MKYDLTKLHPIHQKSFQEFIDTAEFRESRAPDGRLARDVLYEKYLDLNRTVPDIIGKQPSQMSKVQKVRYEAKRDELLTKD